MRCCGPETVFLAVLLANTEASALEIATSSFFSNELRKPYEKP